MHLARFPRRRYTAAPTPLEPLDRLSATLGGPRILVKRDDLLGGAGGGNKTRKLEFLVADALQRGADTLITCGAIQSNHCRLTASAAVREGLKCRLVLEERVAGTYDAHAGGNNFLYRLLGVEDIVVVPDGTDLAQAMHEVDADLQAAGRQGYIIPGGGSSPLGALGYAVCADEILAQAFDQGEHIDHVVVASGSGGTHSGLLAGLLGTRANIPLTGISVRFDAAAQERKVQRLTAAVFDLAGVDCEVPDAAVRVLDAYVGPGYSLPTPQMRHAVQLLARTEAILLDPVYTGKAMAGLIDLVRTGGLTADQTVLFVHTGGTPALYHYRDDVLG